jgi:hypothetical protein
MIRIKSKRGEEGQAVIEFVLGLLVIFSFFFFYIRMSALFAIGNYIHYATFMAARAYSSGSKVQDEQIDRATEIMNAKVVGKFKSLVSAGNRKLEVGLGPIYRESNSPADSWNQGVSYNFKAKLSLYPWSKEGQSITMDLTSESWMPRNITEDECEAAKKQMNGGAISVPNVKVEWDNGC